MKNNEKKVNDGMFSNNFIVYSILVEVVAISIGREGRSNGSNISIYLQLSHFQTHGVYTKKIHGINITLIRSQI